MKEVRHGSDWFVDYSGLRDHHKQFYFNKYFLGEYAQIRMVRKVNSDRSHQPGPFLNLTMHQLIFLTSYIICVLCEGCEGDVGSPEVPHRYYVV